MLKYDVETTHTLVKEIWRYERMPKEWNEANQSYLLDCNHTDKEQNKGKYEKYT